MSRSSQWSWEEVRIRLEQITRVLETDEQKMTKTRRKMLKTILAESRSMIRKVLSNIITAV